MSSRLTTRLDRIAARYAAKSRVSGLGYAIEQPSTGFTWGYGGTDEVFFIASITKLFTTAMIMQLRDEQALTLDTRAAELLGEETMRGLNMYDGHDHGPSITVRELLSHTSGIPDYFEQKGPDGTTLLANMRHTDSGWSFDDILTRVKSMSSRFAPSTPGKAQYCDTNFQLLGRIIETVDSNDFEQIVHDRIIKPLGLNDTWLFSLNTLDRFDQVAPVMHGRRRLHIPKTMVTFAPDGAVVSTPNEQVRFLRAFMGGELFPAHYLPEMTAQWNSVFARIVPIDYGIGMMRFKTPRWQSPLVEVPEMIGHSGAFGNVLYYIPQRDLYISGTVNQMSPRSLPYPVLQRLIAQFR